MVWILKPRLNSAVATVAVETVFSLLRVASLSLIMCFTRVAVIPGRAKREPGISRFRVWSFGPSRNDGLHLEAQPHPLTTLFTILFDGVAYGMLLFVLACGLAVTLGLMNFVNLAHGAFAMTGGYICAVLVNQSGWPFFAALPLAFVASALIGAVLERALYRHLYTRSHLDQVLFSVGLVFMSVAAVDYVMGSSRIFIKLPVALEGQFDLFRVGSGRYRLMIIVICGLLTAALQLILARTRFGSRLRAAVDDPRAASGLGINVPQVFAFTFAFGCGLAGLGGALSAEILGLDPYFPLKFMIYFLIVVTVGGSSSITGPFLASLLLGIGAVARKSYVPKMGPFVIYTIMIVILIWRPNGLCVRTAAR